MLTHLPGLPTGRPAQSVRPCVKANFRVELVEPKHVYLLSEHGSYVLTGRLYYVLVPFLDGRYTVEEIHDLLSGTVSREHIDHVVDRLRRLGYLSDSVHGMQLGAAAFWSELGL